MSVGLACVTVTVTQLAIESPFTLSGTTRHSSFLSGLIHKQAIPENEKYKYDITLTLPDGTTLFYFLCFRHCPQLENDGILNLWIGKLFLREILTSFYEKNVLKKRGKRDIKYNSVDIKRVNN
jgi:hypothetical protein